MTKPLYLFIKKNLYICVLVSYNNITYYLKNYILIHNVYLLFHTVSVGQGFGSGLATSVWLRLSRESKCQLRPHSSDSMTESGRFTSKMVHSHD